MAGRERRVQADAGVGHAERGRPGHPHAITAADAQQARARRAVQAHRHHGQGLDTPLPAFFGGTSDGGRRRGDDGQVHVLGQRGR
jgi:hypothetical protein